MKQMDVPGSIKVNLDFTDGKLPESVRTFRPLLYKEGDTYCCVLGPDPKQGVFGSGKTIDIALKDWDHHLKERQKVNDADDEVAFYINETLKATVKKVW